jgi:hypothetical protein
MLCWLTGAAASFEAFARRNAAAWTTPEDE